MAVNCEPVLASLELSAYIAVRRFLQRAQDPEFRAFFVPNHDKISRFYRGCQELARLLDENNPERRERLKRVLNGPVSLLFCRACQGDKIQVSESQRPSLSEEEFEQVRRTWALRTTIYVQNYLARSDFNQLARMIDGDGEMELVISETLAINFVGFRCGLSKA